MSLRSGFQILLYKLLVAGTQWMADAHGPRRLYFARESG